MNVALSVPIFPLDDVHRRQRINHQGQITFEVVNDESLDSHYGIKYSLIGGDLNKENERISYYTH